MGRHASLGYYCSSTKHLFVSIYFWHDIANSKWLTIHIQADPFPIPVPANDPVFKIPGNPEDFIPVYRSNYNGVDTAKNLRIIPNAFTAFIDCSGLYGNSDDDMKHMRSFQGGKLKSVFLDKGEFPPIVENGPMKGYFDFNIPNLNMMPVCRMYSWLYL